MQCIISYLPTMESTDLMIKETCLAYYGTDLEFPLNLAFHQGKNPR